MRRMIGLVLAPSALALSVLTLSVLAWQSSRADEVRRSTFAAALLGTWTPASQTCSADNKSNLVIAETTYTGANGNCKVGWIVETSGTRGPNYAVHGICGDAAAGPPKQENFVIRPDSTDQISIGTSFDDLKSYQRCAAK
jgi:hypothetical protein